MTLSRAVPKFVRKQWLTQSIRCAVWALLCIAPLTSRATEAVAKPNRTKLDYRFDGQISRPVLENYLARSATVASLLHLTADDDLRMMQNTGVKFAGRVIWMWGSESRIDALVAKGEPFVKRIHKVDPDIVLQGAIFEIITTDVNNVSVPASVFEEFDLKPEVALKRKNQTEYHTLEYYKIQIQRYRILARMLRYDAVIDSNKSKGEVLDETWALLRRN